MEQSLHINRLPTRTWNRLGINDACVVWDAEQNQTLEPLHFAALPGEQADPIRLELHNSDAPYSSQELVLDAAENSRVTLFIHCAASHPFAPELRVTAGPGASVRIVSLLSASDGALLRHAAHVFCGRDSHVTLLNVLLGEGDLYSDTEVQLAGDGSALCAEYAYLARHNHTVDINLNAVHTGKNTSSEINAAGALSDSAKKIFRGTIDFKTGSAGSVGSEQETVLLLGENVVNKTIPIILCAEENVEGSHGATIGELDPETLFYFESRGISRDAAEHIMARAAIERLARLTGDETMAGQIEDALCAAYQTEKEKEEA